MLYQTRVIIADDHTIIRVGIRSLLEKEDRFDIVAEAANGKQVIQLANEHVPDLILMYLSMPYINGTEAISSIKRRNPSIKIIAFTMHHSPEHVRAALSAGAEGYVLKDDDHSLLMLAINEVLSGKVYLSSSVTGDVINGFLHSSEEDLSEPSWNKLSPRERQVLKLVAEGHKNKEVASTMCISIKTVEKHRGNLMKKLNLSNISALTAYAIEHKLIN